MWFETITRVDRDTAVLAGRCSMIEWRTRVVATVDLVHLTGVPAIVEDPAPGPARS